MILHLPDERLPGRQPADAAQPLHRLENRPRTIEDLSRRFHINPTTLKTTFKSVYGTSVAAHIKEHRMREAARLLTETERSIAQIARAVGYGSQSKFSTAFRACFDALPKDYRKQQSVGPAPERCRP